MSRTPHLTWRRRARVVTSLPLVLVAAAATYGFSTPVAVTVDGEVRDLRTYAATVGDVLEQLDVEVGAADEVVPHAGTALEAGMAIDIARAITVDVLVDGGHAFRVTAPVTSVAGVLEEAGLDDADDRGARIDPAPSAPVEDGDVVRVSLPTPVVVAVDGEELDVDTFADDVAAVLDETGVELGPDDLVVPGDGAIVGPTTITVQRVEHVEELEEVVLDHDEVRRESDDVRKGRTEVATEGRDGLREDTYRVTLVDGAETERELIGRQIVREPVDEVVLVGTYEPPPPPPPSPPPAPEPSSSSSSGASSSGSSSSGSSSSGSSSSGSSSGTGGGGTTSGAGGGTTSGAEGVGDGPGPGAGAGARSGTTMGAGTAGAPEPDGRSTAQEPQASTITAAVRSSARTTDRRRTTPSLAGPGDPPVRRR